MNARTPQQTAAAAEALAAMPSMLRRLREAVDSRDPQQLDSAIAEKHRVLALIDFAEGRALDPNRPSDLDRAAARAVNSNRDTTPFGWLPSQRENTDTPQTSGDAA